MGLDDDHWCSDCGKSLNKRKDEYVEMNFNNWKGRHINYSLKHKPSGKHKQTFKTNNEAQEYLKTIPYSRLADRNPENYEIKIIAKKMKKRPTDKHDRVFVCQECYYKFVAQEVERLRKKGNPIFHCSVICWAWKECSLYEPPDGPPIPHTTTPCEFANAGEPERYQEPNCKHISVIDDVIYCKRRHPGAVVLNIEDTMVQQRRMKEYPIFAGEMANQVEKAMLSKEQIKSYLECFPEDLRKVEEAKYNASVNMIRNMMKDMAEKTCDKGSNFFKTQAGDTQLYVEVCEERVIVEKPKEKETEQEEIIDDATTI